MQGTRLGPYEILDKLGEGGMGEVWLAQDTRLGRKVAVKVLPQEFAADPERLARFEQEARAAAALNHPHIAAVHDVGAENGVHYMVQEYLQGHTLRTVLDGGAPGLKRGLALGTEIAEGLRAAHAAGIIHRDLKPENLFVTEDGHAKILDFGLAKLSEAGASPISGGDSQTKSPTLLGTVAGQIMGTAGYMAPEQIQGEGEIDARADLFAFGCVLYELVTGRRAFGGKNLFDTLSQIVSEEPERFAETGPQLPPQLRWIVSKCLAKDRAERYQTAGDLAVDLRRLSADVKAGTAMPTADAGSTSEVASPPAPAAAGISWKLFPLVAVALTALGAAGWAWTRPSAPTPVVHRYLIEYPPDADVTTNFSRGVAISPDGRWIVFAAERQLWLRGVGDLESTPIRGTENLSRAPTFSPDSLSLAFWNGDQVRRVALSGGAAVTLGPAAVRAHGAFWADDGFVYYGQGEEGIFRVSENGGTPELLIDPGDGELTSGAQLLPGEQWLLFTSGTGGYDLPSVEALSTATGERKVVVPGGADGRLLPSGHLVYMVDGNLLAQRFDPDRAETIGGPAVVVEGVRFSGSGAADYAVSDNGTLVYRPGGSGGGGNLILNWIDRDGQAEPLPFPADSYDWPVVSPDGTRVAVQTQEAGPSVIWILELERGTQQRVTGEGSNDFPVWSADGEWVYYAHDTGSDRDIWRRRADLSSAPEPILESDGNQRPRSVSADGELLLYSTEANGSSDLYVVDATGEGEPRPVVATTADEDNASISPDGRFVAFQSDESGENRIYAIEIASGKRWPLSTGLAFFPTWSPRGDEIFYRLFSGEIMSVSVDTAAELAPSAPVQVGQLTTGARGNFTVDADGDRFLFFSDPTRAQTGPTERLALHVVLNWFEELKQRVPIE